MKKKEEKEIEQSSGLSQFTFREWARIRQVRLYIARGAGISVKVANDSLVSGKFFDEAVKKYLNQPVRG